MKHDYVIHSVEPGTRTRTFEVDGETIEGQTSIVIVELVDPEGGPTLTLQVPAKSYEDLGAPGDRVTVTVGKAGAK